MAKVRPSRKVGRKSAGNPVRSAARARDRERDNETRARRGVASKPKATKGRRTAAVEASPKKAVPPPKAEARTTAKLPEERPLPRVVVPVVEVPQTPPPLPAPIASFIF